MDGKQGPEVASSLAGRGDFELQDLPAFRARTLRDLPAFRARTLRDLRQAGDRAGIIEQYQRLDGLRPAPGPGGSPMVSEAVERLRRAITVIAGWET